MYYKFSGNPVKGSQDFLKQTASKVCNTAVITFCNTDDSVFDC